MVAYFKSQSHPVEFAKHSAEDKARYEDSEFGFSLQYPADAEVRQQGLKHYLPVTGNGIVGIFAATSSFQNTNLVEAAVMVGVSSMPSVVGACAAAVSRETHLAAETLADQEFSVSSMTGVVSGNRYESKFYRAARNGLCYEIVKLLHSGNIQNYAPETVREFDRTRVLGFLNEIVGTFTFSKEAGSGVVGTVRMGPICPVEPVPPDPHCAPLPFQTSVTITGKDGIQEETSMDTNTKGNFTVELPPGVYEFRAKGGTILPRCSPTSVTVRPHEFSVLNIICDTGIR